MKLTDPFGRMERRHNAGYKSMRDALQRAGIDTPQAAREVVKQSKQRALKVLIVGLVLMLLLACLLPQTLPIAIAIALFLLVWIATSTVNGKRYIQRYIDEDLK